MLMELLSGPAGLALAAAGGAFAASGVKVASRALTAYVKGTPNKLDDRILAAVKTALRGKSIAIYDEDPR